MDVMLKTVAKDSYFNLLGSVSPKVLSIQLLMACALLMFTNSGGLLDINSTPIYSA
jgi:hypothetical protein